MGLSTWSLILQALFGSQEHLHFSPCVVSRAHTHTNPSGHKSTDFEQLLPKMYPHTYISLTGCAAADGAG